MTDVTVTDEMVSKARDAFKQFFAVRGKNVEWNWTDKPCDGRVMVDAVFHLDRLLEEVLDASVPLVVAGERELLEDVANQFGYHANDAERRWLTTGGLSTLEAVFDALGWDDPHYVDEGGCEHPECTAWATAGTPTDDGYKWLCFKHYQAVHAPADPEPGDTS